MSSTEHWELALFSKQVSPILINQLIANLVENCIERANILLDPDLCTNETNLTTLVHCSPSIERFHGALLFVDISGFTVLSQKLSVDDLRFHINTYFTRMITIIEKHNGEIIKFAGDAVYVIWQTKVHRADDEREFLSLTLPLHIIH